MIFHGLANKNDKKKLCAVSLLIPTLVLSRMHGAGSSPLLYLIRLKTHPCRILSDPSPSLPSPAIHGIVPFPFGLELQLVSIPQAIVAFSLAPFWLVFAAP